LLFIVITSHSNLYLLLQRERVSTCITIWPLRGVFLQLSTYEVLATPPCLTSDMALAWFAARYYGKRWSCVRPRNCAVSYKLGKWNVIFCQILCYCKQRGLSTLYCTDRCFLPSSWSYLQVTSIWRTNYLLPSMLLEQLLVPPSVDVIA